jgi:FAS-associated factor 2
MALTESQQLALDQIRELTNGGSDEVALEVLQSVDWNVEVSSQTRGFRTLCPQERGG